MEVKIGKKVYKDIPETDSIMKDWKNALDNSPRKDLIMELTTKFVMVEPYVSVTKVIRVRKSNATEKMFSGADVIVEISEKKFERLNNIQRQFWLSCACERIDFTVDKEGNKKVVLRKPDASYYSQLEDQFGEEIRKSVCEENYKFFSGEKENAYNVEF